MKTIFPIVTISKYSCCITFRNVFRRDTFARIASYSCTINQSVLPERENNPAAEDLAWFTLIKALLVYLPLYSGHYLKSFVWDTFVWDTFGLKTWTVFNLRPVINDLWLGRPKSLIRTTEFRRGEKNRWK